MDVNIGARWARLDGTAIRLLSDDEAAQAILRTESLHERIALTTFPWGTSVSTIFTGMRFGGEEGRPALWFETVVLCGGDDLTRQHWRHATYQQAIEGHVRVIDAAMRERWGRAWVPMNQSEAGRRGRVAAGY